MTAYGGDERAMNVDAPFAMAIEHAFGAHIRESDEAACEMWCALANVEWTHSNGETAGYSFREAGDLVATIRRNGNYMDWYCCDTDAVVSDAIRTKMKMMGWSPDV